MTSRSSQPTSDGEADRDVGLAVIDAATGAASRRIRSAGATGALEADGFARTEERVRHWRLGGERVVLCHGCFDPLHVGHVLHFQAARKLGDRLVVTVTPDCHVDKGPERPLFSQELRVLMVEALRVVDAACINLWPSAVETIRRLQPAVFAKGADYADREHCNPNIEAEERAVVSVGGSLRYTSELSFSSSALLDACAKRLG